MQFKWKFFKVSLWGGLVLSICCVGGWMTYYIRIRSVFPIGTFIILFFVALGVILLCTFAPFWVMKKKFPAGLITNTVEGIIYLFSIVLFIACAYVALYGIAFLNASVNNSWPPGKWIIFPKYLSIETVAVSAVYIYIGINTFILVKTISKNRMDLMKKISELGNSEI